MFNPDLILEGRLYLFTQNDIHNLLHPKYFDFKHLSTDNDEKSYFT